MTATPISAETSDVQATNLNLSLSGIPRDMVNVAMTETLQNRAAKVWWVELNPVTNAIVGAPVPLFIGRIDLATIAMDASSATVTVAVTNRLADWERAANSLYSSEEQQRRHSGDFGFQYAAAMETRRTIWPMGTYNG